LALNAVADDYTFRLKNTLGFARQNETVEVEIPTDVDLSRKQLTDEHGHVLPYELCGSHAYASWHRCPTAPPWLLA
jgi:hypothetical protein